LKFQSIAGAVGLLSVACLLAWQAHDIHDWAVELLRRLPYPFGLDYGEGVVWQQALTLVDGTAYGRLQTLPATPFNYPPFYHLVVLLGRSLSGADILAVGRAVSALAAVLSGVASAGLIWRVVGGTRGALAGMLVGGLLPISEMPAIAWSGLMRVDGLAVALGLVGLWIGGRAAVSPSARRWAMAVLVLAVYTKQTMILAPLAFLAGLAWVDRRAAWGALGFGFLVAVPPLLVLMAMSDGRVVLHLLVINVTNRFDAGFIPAVLGNMRYALATGAIAAGMLLICAVLNRTQRPDLRDPRHFTLLLLCLNVAFMTVNIVALAKSGSGNNYMLGPLYAVCPLVGVALAWTMRRNWHGLLAPVLAAALLGQFWRSPPFPPLSALAEAPRRAVLEAVRATDGNILAEDPSILLRAGRRYDFEPAMMTELASTGWWDEHDFVSAIQTHRYALLVLEGEDGDEYYDARFTPAMRAAIRTAYPRIERLGNFRLRRPREPMAASG
jgi:hypothetical protein